MIELDEGKLYDAIAQQTDNKFPEASVTDFCHKAIEELGEVLNAPKSKRLGEFADSMICVWRACAKDGWTYEQLMLAAAVKTTVNEVRKFDRLQNGLYQHIESE